MSNLQKKHLDLQKQLDLNYGKGNIKVGRIIYEKQLTLKFKNGYDLSYDKFPKIEKILHNCEIYINKELL
jgi:hypothetical protein